MVGIWVANIYLFIFLIAHISSHGKGNMLPGRIGWILSECLLYLMFAIIWMDGEKL